VDSLHADLATYQSGTSLGSPLYTSIVELTVYFFVNVCVHVSVNMCVLVAMVMGQTSRCGLNLNIYVYDS